MTVLEELEDRALVGIHWQQPETSLFDLIEESDAILVDVTGTGDGWTATLRFLDGDALAEFYETCRSEGVALELQGINESGHERPESPFGMTTPQREALVAAFEAGYFEVPRATTLAELADRLDVSEQALSERLRRGLRKFLEATLRVERASDASETGPE